MTRFHIQMFVAFCVLGGHAGAAIYLLTFLSAFEPDQVGILFQIALPIVGVHVLSIFSFFLADPYMRSDGEKVGPGFVLVCTIAPVCSVAALVTCLAMYRSGSIGSFESLRAGITFVEVAFGACLALVIRALFGDSSKKQLPGQEPPENNRLLKDNLPDE